MQPGSLSLSLSHVRKSHDLVRNEYAFHFTFIHFISISCISARLVTSFFSSYVFFSWLLSLFNSLRQTTYNHKFNVFLYLILLYRLYSTSRTSDGLQIDRPIQQCCSRFLVHSQIVIFCIN